MVVENFEDDCKTTVSIASSHSNFRCMETCMEVIQKNINCRKLTSKYQKAFWNICDKCLFYKSCRKWSWTLICILIAIYSKWYNLLHFTLRSFFSRMCFRLTFPRNNAFIYKTSSQVVSVFFIYVKKIASKFSAG